MSNPEFEDYNTTSNTYDNVRKPIGQESLMEAFATAAKNLGKEVKDLQLLDVGCGTGNYIASFREKIAQCDGLEYNDGMLKQCR